MNVGKGESSWRGPQGRQRASKQAWKPNSTEAVSNEDKTKSRTVGYSHFVSIPLTARSDLLQKLIKFQTTILGETEAGHSGETDHSAQLKISTRASSSGSKSTVLSDLGIDKSIFVNPKTFHLTVLMLKLWNQERVATASDVLQRISPKVMDALANRPISIRLKGLACMRGSPAKAMVVYAPVFDVGEEGRLLQACQVIRDAFIESGLVIYKDAQQTLKLHATMMNVSHRKSEKKIWNDSFDAQHIFNEYGSEEWGEYPIREIHLSELFKYDASGYYHCCSSIALPQRMPTA